MFDFWLILSEFIELFLGGWRMIDAEDLIIQNTCRLPQNDTLMLEDWTPIQSAKCSLMRFYWCLM